ncbi:exlusion protein FxsA [Paenibacillus sp. 32O-W]|uniref:FxsA family protein n=1 Tax=Paenibacillus sp. 32O-W TaxID=1695218 RepID=UPI000722BED0|nr:FxsA family protein [Paenibacillus sp. 32O-W]ALS26901.1 exlusion protein FxsA [Paenibacillus sp. 32O-W]
MAKRRYGARRNAKWLLAALVLVPVIELWGILQMSDWIGGWTTFGFILLTGVLGAWLAQAEGRKVWREAQLQMQQGIIPGRAMLDGLCVALGGLLLMLPGFLSDLLGIALLFPATRPLFRNAMLRWLEKRMRDGSVTLRRW